MPAYAKPSSAPFVALLERMASFTIEERRGFLQFVTGAPSLPVHLGKKWNRSN